MLNLLADRRIADDGVRDGGQVQLGQQVADHQGEDGIQREDRPHGWQEE